MGRAVDQYKAEGWAGLAEWNCDGRNFIEGGWVALQAHCEHIIKRAYFVGLTDIVYELGGETIFEALFFKGDWLVALKHMEFEVVFVAKEEGHACVRDLVVDDSAGGGDKAA